MGLAGGRTVRFPTPDQMSFGHPSRPHQSSLGTREATAFEPVISQLMTPTAETTPRVKSEHLADDDSSRKQTRVAVEQAIQAMQQCQSNEGAKANKKARKMRLGRDLRDDRPARARECARQFSPKFIALVTFLQRHRVHEICQRGDRHSSFTSHLIALE